MAGFNGGYFNNGYNNYAFPQVNYNQPVQAPFVYVHGIEGANAYQLPQGVTRQLLWDDEKDSFYVKALEQYLAPVPRPAYVVQNPNCCGSNYYNACACSAS